MKLKFLQRALCTAGLAAAMAAPALAEVTTIDFEGASLTGLYFADESFTQNGFKMTVDFDAGIVDRADPLDPNAPTGNATQVYSQLNDGGLIVERSDGGLFDLLGFDAAFIPLNPAATGTTVMVAVGRFADNSTDALAWLFAPKNGSGFAFANYSDTVDFASFSQINQVEFFACVYDQSGICATASQNNGQFAIDNIQVGYVPEPGSLALVALSLMGLAASRRRSAR